MPLEGCPLGHMDPCVREKPPHGDLPLPQPSWNARAPRHLVCGAMVPEWMLAMLGSHPGGNVPRCFGWRMEPVAASCCHPRRGIPTKETKGACLGPGRALGPKGKGRGCKLQNGTDAFSLPNPQRCPNLGAGAGSSRDITCCSHGSQKRQGARGTSRLGCWWWQEEVVRLVQR